MYPFVLFPFAWDAEHESVIMLREFNCGTGTHAEKINIMKAFTAMPDPLVCIHVDVIGSLLRLGGLKV